MIRSHMRFVRAALTVVCFAVPALAAAPPGAGDSMNSGIDNPSVDVIRHAMPAPDVTAPPAPADGANPLWAIPLSALAATRGRPLFTPSRRPPAPVIAAVPPPPAPRQPPPPPPPAAPEHPNLTLVGTVAGEGEGVAVFIDKGSRDAVRLRTGEGHLGWVLQSVDRSAATLQKGDQTETLVLPKSTDAQASAPVISPLPPPPPPPPQGGVPAPGRPAPPSPPQQQPPPPRPQSAAPPPNPAQVQGCMPPPVGC
jgi:hypothetical protein